MIHQLYHPVCANDCAYKNNELTSKEAHAKVKVYNFALWYENRQAKNNFDNIKNINNNLKNEQK